MYEYNISVSISIYIPIYVYPTTRYNALDTAVLNNFTIQRWKEIELCNIYLYAESGVIVLS